MEASCTSELAVGCIYANLTALLATVNFGDSFRAKAGERSRGTCVLPSSLWPYVPEPIRSSVVQRVN
jgi:hypothetical protein